MTDAQGALFTSYRVSDGSAPVERFTKWARTPDGAAVVAEVRRRALAQASNGARRIEVNLIVADVRRELRMTVNNSHRAPLARYLVARDAHLGPLIERRVSRRKGGG